MYAVGEQPPLPRLCKKNTAHAATLAVAVFLTPLRLPGPPLGLEI